MAKSSTNTGKKTTGSTKVESAEMVESKSIHIRFTNKNREKINKALAAKMKKESRSKNNCIERIMLEYFALD